jgi:hypothetical protein
MRGGKRGRGRREGCEKDRVEKQGKRLGLKWRREDKEEEGMEDDKERGLTGGGGLEARRGES